MKSLQAVLVDVILRATNRKASIGKRLDGKLPVTSATPGRSVAAVAEITRIEASGHLVWELLPRDARPDAPTVFYVHGGAYINGFDPRHWDFLAALVESTGLRVLAPDYPLSPGTRAEAVIAWTLARYAELAAGHPVILMGDSAGGGLALSIAVAAREAGLPSPAGIELLSPWLDVSMSAADGAELDRNDLMLARGSLLRAGVAYAGSLPLDDAQVSPLFADLHDLPPTNIYCGARDQLVADARRLTKRAREEYPSWPFAYHEAPGMVHVWMLIGFIPEARALMDRLCASLPGA